MVRFASFASALVLAIVGVVAPVSAGPVPASWRVSGDISGHPFVEECRFESLGNGSGGNGFGGVCVDASTDKAGAKPGTVHKLTMGSLAGNQIRWTYPAHAFILSFEVSYSGEMSGDHIAGGVTAAGRKGSFTALPK